MAVSAVTQKYKFNLIDFDSVTWHDDEYANWHSVDAVLQSFFNTSGFTGVWALSTAYGVGDLAVDEVTDEVYEVLVGHTSAASGLFSADRTTNPSFWAVWLLSHAGSTANPHSVTLVQVGGTTALARTLLDDATQGAMHTTLGLVPGTDVQAQDAELAALAALVSAADRLPHFTGSGTAALATFTAAGRALIDDANAAAQRTTLGLVIGTDVLPEMAVVPQAEAEAGTATTERVWTAERVEQAIAVLATPRSHLVNLELSNGSDATNDIDIAVGEARSTADDIDLVVATAIGKRLDATWATGGTVSVPTGGLAATLTIDDVWYHVILGLVSGVVEVGFDTSVTGGTLAANNGFTNTRRIGSIRRVSGVIVPFTQRGDEVLWDVPISDYSVSDPTTAAVPRTLSVPTGVQVHAIHSITAIDDTATTATNLLVTALDQVDTLPTSIAHVLQLVNAGATERVNNSVLGAFRTDTSGQIRVRQDLSTTDHNLRGVTHGYIDRRGRDD